MTTKDVFIKDEGDFATIIFWTDEAQHIILKEGKDVIGELLINKDSIKLDIDIQCVPEMEEWLISHNLSWESDI